ncbi:uncharacterized protein JCM15063_005935 [Sporobolomyces koalae]|uniref:uncharacterized protein n=1 Tax=Sporobolomyces koalae TaxID=500713 RepID=UPI00316C4C1B
MIPPIGQIKEAEGAGMESTFVLESWIEGMTMLDLENSTSESKVKASEIRATAVFDDTKEINQSLEILNLEKVQEEDKTQVADETVTALAPEAIITNRDGSNYSIEHQDGDSDQQPESETEHGPHLTRPEDRSLGLSQAGPQNTHSSDDCDQEVAQSSTRASEEPSEPKMPSLEELVVSSPHAPYNASYLPPRRPRPPQALHRSSSSDRPVSDEDELAYLIRTTATHSSEDDLHSPLAHDKFSSEEVIRHAERGTGGVSKSDGIQSKMPAELSADKKENPERGLVIGPGRNGRRLGWKRWVLDVAEMGDSGDDELSLCPQIQRAEPC